MFLKSSFHFTYLISVKWLKKIAPLKMLLFSLFKYVFCLAMKFWTLNCFCFCFDFTFVYVFALFLTVSRWGQNRKGVKPSLITEGFLGFLYLLMAGIFSFTSFWKTTYVAAISYLCLDILLCLSGVCGLTHDGYWLRLLTAFFWSEGRNQPLPCFITTASRPISRIIRFWFWNMYIFITWS